MPLLVRPPANVAPSILTVLFVAEILPAFEMPPVKVDPRMRIALAVGELISLVLSIKIPNPLGARILPLSEMLPVIVLPVIDTAVLVLAPLPALIVPALETLPVNDVLVTVMQVMAAELLKFALTAVQLPAAAGPAAPIRSATIELDARRPSRTGRPLLRPGASASPVPGIEPRYAHGPLRPVLGRNGIGIGREAPLLRTNVVHAAAQTKPESPPRPGL